MRELRIRGAHRTARGELRARSRCCSLRACWEQPAVLDLSLVLKVPHSSSKKNLSAPLGAKYKSPGHDTRTGTEGVEGGGGGGFYLLAAREDLEFSRDRETSVKLCPPDASGS